MGAQDFSSSPDITKKAVIKVVVIGLVILGGLVAAGAWYISTIHF